LYERQALTLAASRLSLSREAVEGFEMVATSNSLS